MKTYYSISNKFRKIYILKNLRGMSNIVVKLDWINIKFVGKLYYDILVNDVTYYLIILYVKKLILKKMEDII